MKTAIIERNTVKRQVDMEKSKVTRNEDRIKELLSNYRRKKLDVKRIIEEEKLEADSMGNKKLLYKVIKDKRKDNDQIRAIETDTGEIVREEKEILRKTL